MFTIYGVPLSIHVRKVIVAALEKRFPEPPLYPSDPEQYADLGRLLGWSKSTSTRRSRPT